MIIDNFLQSFDSLRDYADHAKFSDEENSVDGVTYPKICKDLPRPIREEVLQRLAIIKGGVVEDYTLFLRQSPSGVPCPHQAHADNSMGLHSLMLYVNRQAHCQGGTSLLRHRKTGIAYTPENEVCLRSIIEDQNTPEAWIITDLIEMRPNRAFIFDASRLHRAEPIGGFGQTNEDARLVLTCFFR